MFMGIDPGRDKCANVPFDPAVAANVPFDPAGAGVEYFMGIDPGRDKCGVAVLNAAGEIKFQRVIATDELDSAIKNLSAQFEIKSVILGNGTTHKSAAEKISAAGLKFQIVDEKHTTEEARREYWIKNPPRGWRRLLPTSMQVPPEPVDAIVAEILVRRFLSAQ